MYEREGGLFQSGVVDSGDVVNNESHNLKMLKDGYVHSQIMDLFGRNDKIYHCCMDI